MMEFQRFAEADGGLWGLTPSTPKSIIRNILSSLVVTRGSNSVVECNLAKVEVAGSNPVSRSNYSRELVLGKCKGEQRNG